MVYEQLPTRSHVVTASEDIFQVSLISQDPLPPIHQTCQLLYAEATPFIRRLRQLTPPPRAVFEIDDTETLILYHSLTDTLMSVLRTACGGIIEGYSITKCQEEVRAFIQQFFRNGPTNIEHEWIHRNLEALMKWS